MSLWITGAQGQGSRSRGPGAGVQGQGDRGRGTGAGGQEQGDRGRGTGAGGQEQGPGRAIKAQHGCLAKMNTGGQFGCSGCR